MIYLLLLFFPKLLSGSHCDCRFSLYMLGLTQPPSFSRTGVSSSLYGLQTNGRCVLDRFIWKSAHSVWSHLTAVKPCYIISVNRVMRLGCQQRIRLINHSKCLYIFYALFVKSVSENCRPIKQTVSVLETCHRWCHWQPLADAQFLCAQNILQFLTTAAGFSHSIILHYYRFLSHSILVCSYNRLCIKAVKQQLH